MPKIHPSRWAPASDKPLLKTLHEIPIDNKVKTNPLVVLNKVKVKLNPSPYSLDSIPITHI